MLPVAPPVEGRDWLTNRSPSWSELRGRVVVVLFWSFGCEASLLAARRLSELTELWPKDVTVLAVHTPRFPYEDDAGRVREAVARHRIGLPVVHDPDYLTWNRYNPEGWPATAVIDRSGRVLGINAGASGIELIDEAVATELARPSGRSRASDRPGSAAGLRSVVDLDRGDHDTTLRFPAGVAVSPGGRIAIADSGNDRLLVGDIDADLRTVRPEIEITDIDNPVAVTCGSDSIIYAVEAGTGSVLQIDLDHGTLDVLADDELAAPTAVAVDRDGSVVVADAGHDQLFRITGRDKTVHIGPIAGSGLSGCRDGAAARAELAQPVGLTTTASGLAFCDAASSNIRLLGDDGRVATITGNDFFDWGLVDGPAHRARLQRPTGICAMDDGSIVIADTGNNRLRVLQDRKIRTLGLSGLNQPTGVARLATGHLLIADTANHRLVVADPAARDGWPLAVYPAVMSSVWEEAATADGL